MDGSNALAVPLPMYYGQWSNAQPAGGSIEKAQGMLVKMTQDERLRSLTLLDLDRMAVDLKSGLWIESNIPSGYGIGSSGVVTALIYRRYAFEPKTDTVALKSDLAAIESFFHGKSSGIDPLTSYCNAPIFVNGGTEAEILSHFEPVKLRLYLLDSGRKRQSTPTLVRQYQERTNQDQFIKDEVADLWECQNHAAMSYQFTTGENIESELFMDELCKLSTLQLSIFNHIWIPPDIRETWENGILDNKRYIMKLCGAGGGGFYQVWSRKKLGKSLNGFKLIEVIK